MEENGVFMELGVCRNEAGKASTRTRFATRFAALRHKLRDVVILEMAKTKCRCRARFGTRVRPLPPARLPRQLVGSGPKRGQGPSCDLRPLAVPSHRGRRQHFRPPCGLQARDLQPAGVRVRGRRGLDQGPPALRAETGRLQHELLILNWFRAKNDPRILLTRRFSYLLWRRSAAAVEMHYCNLLMSTSQTQG